MVCICFEAMKEISCLVTRKKYSKVAMNHNHSYQVGGRPKLSAAYSTA